MERNLRFNNLRFTPGARCPPLLLVATSARLSCLGAMMSKTIKAERAIELHTACRTTLFYVHTAGIAKQGHQRDKIET